MPDTGAGSEWSVMSCEAMQQRLRQGRTLTAAESAHVKGCDTCLEAWLDATVTQALDAKPEVEIPADFAARVVRGLPAKRGAVGVSRKRSPHWGLATAIVLVAAGLIAMTVADPVRANTWIGALFLGLVVSEIAGIALWLGVGRPGSRV
jgi:hypothetical protein